MAYASAADWTVRFGEMDVDLAVGVVIDALGWASRQIDRRIGRRSLEPKTVTDHRWEVRSNRPDSRVFLPDWPPLQPELWFCTLTSMRLYDPSAELQQTVTVGDCVVWPERYGLVVLPDANWVDDRWTVEASYACGYGSDVATPTVPEDLKAACVYLARAHVEEALHLTALADAPVWNARAQTLLDPWRKVPVA
jgi:hypothetical protein